MLEIVILFFNFRCRLAYAVQLQEEKESGGLLVTACDQMEQRRVTRPTTNTLRQSRSVDSVLSENAIELHQVKSLVIFCFAKKTSGNS